jgi:chromosome segregation ATPase
LSDTSDIKLVCRECGKGFLFTEGEQEFYKNKGLTTPSRCPDCRVTKRSQTQSQTHSHSLVCSHCRTELEKDESIFCTACLASTQLESELKVKECQTIVEKAKSELSVLESQKIEIEDSLLKTSEMLQQKEHHTEELEHRINVLKQELEKAKQFQTTMEWLKPSLSKLEERLNELEEGQNKTNQRMLQIVQKIHEISENTGIWERIRRSLFGYQRQSI